MNQSRLRLWVLDFASLLLSRVSLKVWTSDTELASDFLFLKRASRRSLEEEVMHSQSARISPASSSPLSHTLLIEITNLLGSPFLHSLPQNEEESQDRFLRFVWVADWTPLSIISSEESLSLHFSCVFLSPFSYEPWSLGVFSLIMAVVSPLFWEYNHHFKWVLPSDKDSGELLAGKRTLRINETRPQVKSQKERTQAHETGTGPALDNWGDFFLWDYLKVV